jgi:enamine deaminase RidA (YjgF/YER057c/UK114 family)
VTEGLLLGIAGVSATVVGLFLVGAFFYVEAGMRQQDGHARAAMQPYMRAGTRIVMLLFALALFLSLALAALDLSWARALYVVLTLLLVVANVETALRVRSVRLPGQPRTLLLNEIVGTIGVVLIVVLPWVLGGWRPGREELTLAALLALGTAFVSVGAMALSAFDVARLDAGTGAGSDTRAGDDAAGGGVVRVVNPAEGVYPATADYAHAIEVRGAGRLVFVAGTMGLDTTGAAGATLAEQLTLVWSNIRAILAAAGLGLHDVVRVTSYLRDGSYAEENARARVAALGDRAVPTTAIVTQTLADDWLVEIEVIAAGAGHPGVVSRAG